MQPLSIGIGLPIEQSRKIPYLRRQQLLTTLFDMDVNHPSAAAPK
jgi:hypothetical protein